MLGDDVGQRCRELLREIAQSLELVIYAGSINRDHVHMLIGIRPNVSVSRAVLPSQHVPKHCASLSIRWKQRQQMPRSLRPKLNWPRPNSSKYTWSRRRKKLSWKSCLDNSNLTNRRKDREHASGTNCLHWVCDELSYPSSNAPVLLCSQPLKEEA